MKRIATVLLLFASATAGGADIESKKASRDAAVPMGRLGHQMGKYLTIEGERHSGGKGRGFVVDTVNQEKLSEPIPLPLSNVNNLPVGTRCVVRGYESGKMIGVPHEVAEKEGLEVEQAVFQFYRYFVVTSVIEPKDLRFEPRHPRRGQR